MHRIINRENIKKMKRFTLIITIIALSAAAYAQSNLKIAPIFQGKGKWAYKFDATHIEGSSLEGYKLTLFKSATTSDYRLYKEIEGIIEEDGKESIDKECGYINGRLYYGFYQLKPVNGRYRYIFYRNSSLRDDEPNEVTIVYMEGYPTLKELKKMFQ